MSVLNKYRPCDVTVFIKGAQNAQFSFAFFLKISETVESSFLEQKQVLTSSEKF